MKINKLLIITTLLIAITTLIVSFKTQKNITDNKKINIPKIDIPKVTVTKITIHKEEDELSKIVSSLKSIVEEETEEIEQNKPTEDEVQNILSSLKELKPKEEKRKTVSKKIHIVKKIVKKRKIIRKKVKKRRDIIKKKHMVKYVKHKKNAKCKKVIIVKSQTKNESMITEEEYRKRLARESKIDQEIASLALVATVDMDIEQQIKEGKREKLTTPKPLVEQQTIFIDSNEQKIDNNIPLAELKEVD